MMYPEFVALSGQEITFEQYNDIIEPMYMAVENMTKQQFVEFIRPSCKALVKARLAEERKNQRKVFLTDGSKTPNGCYYMGAYYKLVKSEVNIRKGTETFYVRELDQDEFDELCKFHTPFLSTGYQLMSGVHNIKKVS